ncbi:hypothetical protein NMY22_g11875 [Coprinellus aureogranulatus]|nr:hypothetical protein NMY22_g11875 [Coprinellus aureogranulatus]
MQHEGRAEGKGGEERSIEPRTSSAGLSLGSKFQARGSGRSQSTVPFLVNGMAIAGRARAEMAGRTKEEEAPEEPILDSGISLIPDDA